MSEECMSLPAASPSLFRVVGMHFSGQPSIHITRLLDISIYIYISPSIEAFIILTHIRRQANWAVDSCLSIV